MAVPQIQPTGVEQRLPDGEIIVSKTDPKGRLTYVNDVFVDISGYAEQDLLGQPHNVIRHPDMPRAVFELLWQTIQAGEEIFAYVVNLCHDGGHYWVLAHVTPTFGDDGTIVGFHSNRRSPAPGALAVIEPLYAELRRVEAAHTRRRDAIDASMARLSEILADRGLTYDEFVWSLETTEEVAA